MPFPIHPKPSFKTKCSEDIELGDTSSVEPRLLMQRPWATVTSEFRWHRISDVLFATRSQPTEYWEHAFLLLLLAFAARAFVALWGDFVLHPDEIMQYLEPAHHAVFGNGVLHWEHVYGARNWLIPGAVAGVLKTLDVMGLGRPAIYIPVVKLCFCLLSLLVPWAMYRIMQRTADERAARLALIFGCFWYELVALAHKPFTEFVATAIFMVAFAFSVGGNARRGGKLFCVGLLAALTGAIRFQYVPLALLLLLLRSASLRGRELAALWMGALTTLWLVGILEWQTWGAPFHSYLTNALVNLSLDSLRVGESSRWLLLGQLVAASGGGALIALAAGIGMGGRHLLIWLIGIVTLVTHLLPEHREYRFIYLLIPCWLMLLAALVTRLGAVRTRSCVAATMLTFGLLALLNVFPWQSWVHKSFSREETVHYLRHQDTMFEAMLFLSEQKDVRAVLYQAGRRAYFATGGYYYLHHDVPFYNLDALAMLQQHRPEARLTAIVSHVVSEAGAQLDHFEPLWRKENLIVWRRQDNNGEVLGWDEHTIRVATDVQHVSVTLVTRNLRRIPLLGGLVADMRWEQPPPAILMASE